MDLTTTTRVKDYLAGFGIPTTTAADALVAAAISRASDLACNWTGRNFQRQTWNAVRLNGNGASRMMLPQNPVVSVSALSVDGVAYAASADAIATGYQFDAKFLYLFGGAYFCRGMRNVQVSFVSGYTTTQNAFIPAATPYTVTPTTGSGIGPDGAPANTSGPAVVDRGVANASTGVAFALVANAPAAGQYAFSGGVYTFAAADAGALVAISYDFVPGSVEQAVIETVGSMFKRRGELGIESKTLATETISYRDLALSAAAKTMLQPYRFVVSP